MLPSTTDRDAPVAAGILPGLVCQHRKCDGFFGFGAQPILFGCGYMCRPSQAFKDWLWRHDFDIILVRGKTDALSASALALQASDRECRFRLCHDEISFYFSLFKIFVRIAIDLYH